MQTVCTQQNVSCTETRKIVNSRSPTVGISYAAVAEQNSNKKTYQTVETRTDFSIGNIIEIQKTKENINKILKNLTQTPKISKPYSSKLPLHRRAKSNTPSTQTTKHVYKSSSEKNNLPSIKSSINSSNLFAKKLKKICLKQAKIKKKIQYKMIFHSYLSIQQILQKIKTVNSDEDNTDIYIFKKRKNLL